MDNKTRFTFVRDRHGRLIGCLAYRLDAKQGVLQYEVSTHNVKKDEYDRKLAREVAEGRLHVHPRSVTFNPLFPPKLDVLLESASVDLVDSDTVPNRLKKGLQLRLRYLKSRREAQSQPVDGK